MDFYSFSKGEEGEGSQVEEQTTSDDVEVGKTSLMTLGENVEVTLQLVQVSFRGNGSSRLAEVIMIMDINGFVRKR